jgi:molybdate transport system substrate-binding protein
VEGEGIVGDGLEPVGELVGAGQAQMAIQQLPELLAVPGIVVVGPLPDEVQKINTTAAGVFTRSQAGAAALGLIEFLASPAAREVLRANGFEPAVG